MQVTLQRHISEKTKEARSQSILAYYRQALEIQAIPSTSSDSSSFAEAIAGRIKGMIFKTD